MNKRIEDLKVNHLHCLINDSWGVYIPQRFAEEYGSGYLKAVENDGEDLAQAQERLDILADPDHEYYWDAWDEVLDHGRVDAVDGSGKSLWIFQDGDLWGWDNEAAMHECNDLENCN